MELKSIQNPNVNTAVTRIQDGFRRNTTGVIWDTRGTGLTLAQANEIVIRTAGSYATKTLPGPVQIWTDFGTIYR
jgi:hypothetical protein